MFCMKCGTQLPDDALFCYKCGNKIVPMGDAGASSTVQTTVEPVGQEVGVVVEAGPAAEEQPMSRLEKLQQKAEAGNVLAQIGLAEAYLNGNGCEVNKDKAIEWYQKAADLGDEDAKKALASLSGGKKPKSPIKQLKIDANSGNTEAQVKLAKAYLEGNYNGQSIGKNEERAFTYFDKAAKANNPEGVFGLAKCYHHGIGTAIDLVTASELYNKVMELTVDVTGEYSELWSEAMSAVGEVMNDQADELQKMGVFDDDNSVKLAMSILVMSVNESGAFNGSSKFFVTGNISSRTLTNAMKTYGYACGINKDGVWLLCDDTLLMESGTIGFVIDSDGIATSRKTTVKFADMQAIELSGYEVVVTWKNGNRMAIYDIDGLSDSDRDDLDGALTMITEVLNKGMDAFNQ